MSVDPPLTCEDACRYLADPKSWGGNPHNQEATIYGHFTPYELARRALGLPTDPDVES